MSAKAIDPGKGWRLLEPRECVERGDQHYSSGEWFDCEDSVGHAAIFVAPVRRRISAPSVERIDHAALPVDGSDGVVRPAAIPPMTLRDWFAGQAASGMLASPDCICGNESLAEYAYKIADAMLAERSRGGAK